MCRRCGAVVYTPPALEAAIERHQQKGPSVEDLERNKEQTNIAAADFIPQDADQYKQDDDFDPAAYENASCFSCYDAGCDECDHLDS